MEREEPHTIETEPLPPALIARLRSSADARLFVPPDVDEAVLREAERHLRAIRRRRRFRRFAGWGGAAAAAAVALTATLWLIAPPRQYAREDIDRSGRVDIVDALLLARGLEAGPAADRWDVNADGIVDQRDVDAIAMRAVALNGSRS